MNTYKIEIEVDGIVEVSRWSGYTERVAICQAFLYYAQAGARKLQVIEIELI